MARRPRRCSCTTVALVRLATLLLSLIGRLLLWHLFRTITHEVETPSLNHEECSYGGREIQTCRQIMRLLCEEGLPRK